MIESTRKIWKQLTLMEDGMLIHRIMRSLLNEYSRLILVIYHQTKLITMSKRIINKMKKTPIR